MDVKFIEIVSLFRLIHLIVYLSAVFNIRYPVIIFI